MSKTIVDQVEKARTLAGGIRAEEEQVKGYGLNAAYASELEKACEELAVLDRKTDEAREALHQQIAETNEHLSRLKEKVQNAKKIIKMNFDNTRWASLGVTDKR